jgi:hypothetical protein
MPVGTAAGTSTPGGGAQCLNFDVAALRARLIEGLAWTGWIVFLANGYLRPRVDRTGDCND